jgi:hypothetical protein
LSSPSAGRESKVSSHQTSEDQTKDKIHDLEERMKRVEEAVQAMQHMRSLGEAAHQKPKNVNELCNIF